MGCRSGVHDPGVGPLDRHLVEGGDQACLIPPAWSPIRRGTGRAGELRRREGGVRLWGDHGRRTTLLWLGGPLGGPRVEADPGSDASIVVK